MSNLSISYHVPFHANENTAKNGLININGEAIDDSVNQNHWQVPAEDLDFLVESLKGAQLRIDHIESVLSIVGKVTGAERIGNKVNFEAEVTGDALIEKIIRGYLNAVSCQVDSENVQCSKCFMQSRKDGLLIHLCPDAWEIVHSPKVRELSIVASPAYANSKFKPLGFASAMDASQHTDISKWKLYKRIQVIGLMAATEKLQQLEEKDFLAAKRSLAAKISGLQIDAMTAELQRLEQRKAAEKPTVNPFAWLGEISKKSKGKEPLFARYDPVALENFAVAERLDEINGFSSFLNPLTMQRLKNGLQAD